MTEIITGAGSVKRAHWFLNDNRWDRRDKFICDNLADGRDRQAGAAMRQPRETSSLIEL
jgi:hypothetical protein